MISWSVAQQGWFPARINEVAYVMYQKNWPSLSRSRMAPNANRHAGFAGLETALETALDRAVRGRRI